MTRSPKTDLCVSARTSVSCCGVRKSSGQVCFKMKCKTKIWSSPVALHEEDIIFQLVIAII